MSHNPKSLEETRLHCSGAIYLPHPAMGVDTEKFKKLFIIDDGVEILEELTEKQLIEGLVSER